nr:reverse transcriptase domain-containing protein [Tanacetum cinerariifolium]
MRTRNSYYPNNSSLTISRRQNKRRAPNVVEPEFRTIVEVAPMADNRTMEELLQAPTEGFEETFGEAWERFKEMLRACPHHGFTELTQIDTFYNGLNENDQGSLNAAAGGNLLTSTSGTLPSNTIPNSNGEMKAITTRSGVAYEGPSIPTYPFPKNIVKRETEETTDKEETNFQGSTTHIQPPVVPIPEPDVSKTLPKPNIPYPSRLNDQKLHEKATSQMEKFFQIFKICTSTLDKLFELSKIPLNENCSAMLLKKLLGKLGDPGKFLIPWRSFLRTIRALIDVYGEEITLWINDEAVTFNLNQTTRYSSTYDDMSGSDFILEEIEAYLKDESILPEIDHADYDPEGDICLIKILLNDDPFQLPPIDLKPGEVTKAKSLIEEPLKLELKDLPSHLEYAYLEGADTLPVIIAKDLKDDEK